VELPPDFVEPVDFIATESGFVVVGALGDVVVVGFDGIAARTNVAYDPQSGAPRLVVLPDGALALEDLLGARTLVDLDPGVLGELALPGMGVGGGYVTSGLQTGEVRLSSASLDGPLSEISVTSEMRIVNARVLWADTSGGALIALQESRLLPDEQSFVRLVKVDRAGRSTSEAYLAPAAFACDTRRPYARLTDGTIASLAFGSDQSVELVAVEFVPIGEASPIELGRPSDVSLISGDGGVLEDLERLNGTPSASSISLSSVTVATILERARAALDLRWQLAPRNYAHDDVQNRCEPPTYIWRRPARLDGLEGMEVVAVPYRWGGYTSSLKTFRNHLNDGRLAGDDCTCRNANCVHPDATGLDCSGFVSMAWAIGNYFTTSSLGSSSISQETKYADLQPGDIVNKAGSHVRLVESISEGSQGVVVTVIESAANESCGGVCRRAYLQADLQQEGYIPLRRLALIQ
jgi:hypothetical protein